MNVMKRFIAFALALIFILSFSACNEQEVQNESSEISDETSVVLNEFVMSDEVEKIDGYLTNDIDRSLRATNLFRGKQYKISKPTSESYADNHGFKLTDGSTVKVFDAYSYLGWEGRTEVSIDFDLGSTEHSIADITVGCLRVMDYGIGLPRYVSLRVSEDGKEYTEVAKIMTPTDVVPSMKYEYSFALPKGTSARYIRIYCAQPDNAFTFIDEISAYEYSESGTIDRTIGVDADQLYTVTDYYDYKLNLGESSVAVSESDKDYNTEQNLSLLDGVEFQVYHFDPLTEDHSNSPKEKLSLLKNGVTHGEFNTDYFISYRGGGRHIVADLGQVMSVSGTNLYFYDRYTYGISTPPVFYVSLSENGKDWTTVYATYKENYGKEEKIHDTHKIDFKGDYRARYVRVTFETVPDNSVSCAVYLGEFEIIGKKNADLAVTAVENNDTPYGKYVKTEDYGIKNILFAPITDGYGKHCVDVHAMSEESAYIYLTEFDKNGKPCGTFMDSMAFSTRGALNDHKDRNECMEWFFSELFYEGMNLDAVDKAKEKLNSELGVDEKVKIWVSVNAPAQNDIFDGQVITTNKQYDACLKWQVDEIIKRFNEQNYKNLEFVGFYWQFESVRTEEDVDGMKALNDYVHSKGYMTFWCPYYNAAGIYYNQYVGFDITCLQPNYMFYDTEPTRLQTTAERAKLYGMCVEIEIEDGTQSSESLKLYRDYLRAGYDTGYMNSIKVYYQGGLPGAYVTGYNSDDAFQKAVYDETVLYATGKLESNYHTSGMFDLSSFNDIEITVRHGKKAKIELGELGEIVHRFVTTPAYGAVRLNSDGILTYDAMYGYKGEDIIKIELYDGVGDSKIITVKVTVTE